MSFAFNLNDPDVAMRSRISQMLENTSCLAFISMAKDYELIIVATAANQRT